MSSGIIAGSFNFLPHLAVRIRRLLGSMLGMAMASAKPGTLKWGPSRQRLQLLRTNNPPVQFKLPSIPSTAVNSCQTGQSSIGREHANAGLYLQNNVAQTSAILLLLQLGIRALTVSSTANVPYKKCIKICTVPRKNKRRIKKGMAPYPKPSLTKNTHQDQKKHASEIATPGLDPGPYGL